MSYYVECWDRRRIDIEIIKDELFSTLYKKSKMSKQEINAILKEITLCTIYGSAKKCIEYKEGWIFRKDKKYYYNDIDIAVVFKTLPKDFKTSNIKTDGFEIFLENDGYWSKKIGEKFRHYFLLTEKDFKKGIKNKDKVCLAINNGKRIYKKLKEVQK